jgi:hypothetical protein
MFARNEITLVNIAQNSSKVLNNTLDKYEEKELHQWEQGSILKK